MNGDDLTARAIALHDRFTHGPQDRRSFMRDMTWLAGSAAAANLLAGAIGASPASAALIAEDDKRLDIKANAVWPGANTYLMRGYIAVPKAGKRRKIAPVIVIHENRGLQPYTRDVARRLAVAGFVGIAPDFLSGEGGTPAGDDDKARTMIGALDMAKTISDGVATVDHFTRPATLNGKVGVIGFCWGGALADWIATTAGERLTACAAFYGPPPPPSEAAKVKAAMMLHYAGTDDRVNAGAGAWVDALKAAGVDVTRYDYPGTQHAFHNDGSVARYDAPAAALAWDRTIAFFKEKLA